MTLTCRARCCPKTWTRSKNGCARSIKADVPFVYREVSADEARKQFADQPYKIELINDLEKGGVDEYGNATGEPVKISFYTHGPFTDLCEAHTSSAPARSIRTPSS